MSARVDALFDDPDFVGLVFQHYHTSGDERIPAGSSHFMPRHAGRDLIERTLERGDGSNPSFEAWPVYSKTAAAAPELLEALALAESRIVKLYSAIAVDASYRNSNAFADKDPVVSCIRAAIAKAKGGAL